MVDKTKVTVWNPTMVAYRLNQQITNPRPGSRIRILSMSREAQAEAISVGRQIDDEWKREIGLGPNEKKPSESTEKSEEYSQTNSDQEKSGTLSGTIGRLSQRIKHYWLRGMF